MILPLLAEYYIRISCHPQIHSLISQNSEIVLYPTGVQYIAQDQPDLGREGGNKI